MSAPDYFKELEETVTRFQRYWYEQHRLNPSEFPLVLAPGDWHEQFLTFMSL